MQSYYKILLTLPSEMIALKIAIKFLNNDNDKEYGYYSKKNLTKHTKNTSHCYCLGGGGVSGGSPRTV